MVQSPLDDVVSHWHKLIDNFSTSSGAFYNAVEVTLDDRKIAGLKTARVNWNEGGVLSPRREYLRVYGEHHCFDVCAAPFGNGYFFSSWVTAQRARFVTLYYTLFLVSGLFVWQACRMLLGLFWSPVIGTVGTVVGPMLAFAGILLVPVAFLIVLWGVALLARGGHYDAERAMLTIPLVGWFYQTTFAPPTYYRLDTMYMFQSAVQSAMQEVINGLLTAKGLRALNESEFKPIDRQLAGERERLPDGLLTAATST